MVVVRLPGVRRLLAQARGSARDGAGGAAGPRARRDGGSGDVNAALSGRAFPMPDNRLAGRVVGEVEGPLQHGGGVPYQQEGEKDVLAPDRVVSEPLGLLAGQRQDGFSVPAEREGMSVRSNPDGLADRRDESSHEPERCSAPVPEAAGLIQNAACCECLVGYPEREIHRTDCGTAQSLCDLLCRCDGLAAVFPEPVCHESDPAREPIVHADPLENRTDVHANLALGNPNLGGDLMAGSAGEHQLEDRYLGSGKVWQHRSDLSHHLWVRSPFYAPAHVAGHAEKREDGPRDCPQSKPRIQERQLHRDQQDDAGGDDAAAGAHRPNGTPLLLRRERVEGRRFFEALIRCAREQAGIAPRNIRKETVPSRRGLDDG